MKICPSCNAHNLDTWTECGRCHEPLPTTAAANGEVPADPYAARELLESINQLAPARPDEKGKSWLLESEGAFGTPVHVKILGAAFVVFLFVTIHSWTALRTYMGGAPLTGEYTETVQTSALHSYSMQVGMATGLHAWYGAIALLLFCMVVSFFCFRAEFRGMK